MKVLRPLNRKDILEICASDQMPGFDLLVRNCVAANRKFYPEVFEFIESVERFTEELGRLPETFDFTVHPKIKPELMGQTTGEVFLNLIANLRGWLGFYFYTSAYKFKHSLLDIIDGFNRRHFPRVAQSARAFMEEAAAFNEFSSSTTPKFELLLKEFPRRPHLSKNDFSEFVRVCVEVIEISCAAAQRGRINWRAVEGGGLSALYRSSWKEAGPSRRAPTIQSLLEKLPNREPSYRFYYAVLCDLVHPNAGSRTLLINAARELRDGRLSFSLGFAPESQRTLIETLHLVGLPIASLLPLARAQLQRVSALLRDLENRLRAVGR